MATPGHAWVPCVAGPARRGPSPSSWAFPGRRRTEAPVGLQAEEERPGHRLQAPAALCTAVCGTLHADVIVTVHTDVIASTPVIVQVPGHAAETLDAVPEQLRVAAASCAGRRGCQQPPRLSRHLPVL